MNNIVAYGQLLFFGHVQPSWYVFGPIIRAFIKTEIGKRSFQIFAQPPFKGIAVSFGGRVFNNMVFFVFPVLVFVNKTK